MFRKINTFDFHFVLSILVAFILLPSCSDNDMMAELTYPQTYTFSSQEYGESLFCRRAETGYEEITPTPYLLQFDSFAREEIRYEILDFPYRKVELLSDSTVRLDVEVTEGNILSVESFYTEENDVISIFAGSGNNLELEHNGDYSQLRFCFYGYFYNYFDDFFQIRRYSGVISRDCTVLPGNMATVTNEIFTTEELAIRDTLVVVPSHLVLEPE